MRNMHIDTKRGEKKEKQLCAPPYPFIAYSAPLTTKRVHAQTKGKFLTMMMRIIKIIIIIITTMMRAEGRRKVMTRCCGQSKATLDKRDS